MSKLDPAILLSIAIITGFGGDALLQVMTHYGLGTESGWGLNSYFSQHGRIESTFIAGGMLGLFFVLYYITGLEFTVLNMLIYGILLDLVFRVFGIFPSLQGYYEHLNYFWSAVWGAIPMILPLIIYKIYNNDIIIF
jgi:hypothetical protein